MFEPVPSPMGIDLAPGPDDASRADAELVASLPVVRHVLEACRQATGLRFVAVARVTDDWWTVCSSIDEPGIGPPGWLPASSTLCREVVERNVAIAIDDVPDDERYAQHPVLVEHAFRSYVSVPLCVPGGQPFGALCAMDTRPASVDDERILGSLRLYAELLALHIDAARRLDERTAELVEERGDAELREQLLAVLGHDLRNPLGAIGVNAQLIETLADQDDVVEASRSIGRSVRRMSELVGNLLDLARTRGGEVMPLEISAAPELSARLLQVIVELEAVWTGRRIERHLLPDMNVRCDADRLAQLLSNLLANALEHGSPDAPVVVRTVLAGGRFRLEVDNGGTPVPPAAREHLFRPFLRGEVRAGAPGALAGLGLGLHIARQIAEAHGGTLDYRSDGTLTRFAFSMPMR